MYWEVDSKKQKKVSERYSKTFNAMIFGKIQAIKVKDAKTGKVSI